MKDYYEVRGIWRWLGLLLSFPQESLRLRGFVPSCLGSSELQTRFSSVPSYHLSGQLSLSPITVWKNVLTKATARGCSVPYVCPSQSEAVLPVLVSCRGLQLVDLYTFPAFIVFLSSFLFFFPKQKVVSLPAPFSCMAEVGSDFEHF